MDNEVDFALIRSEALYCLRREQLVNLCKRHGIKPQGKPTQMADALRKSIESKQPSRVLGEIYSPDPAVHKPTMHSPPAPQDHFSIYSPSVASPAALSVASGRFAGVRAAWTPSESRPMSRFNTRTSSRADSIAASHHDASESELHEPMQPNDKGELHAQRISNVNRDHFCGSPLEMLANNCAMHLNSFQEMPGVLDAHEPLMEPLVEAKEERKSQVPTKKRKKTHEVPLQTTSGKKQVCIEEPATKPLQGLAFTTTIEPSTHIEASPPTPLSQSPGPKHPALSPQLSAPLTPSIARSAFKPTAPKVPYYEPSVSNPLSLGSEERDHTVTNQVNERPLTHGDMRRIYAELLAEREVSKSKHSRMRSAMRRMRHMLEPNHVNNASTSSASSHRTNQPTANAEPQLQHKNTSSVVDHDMLMMALYSGRKMPLSIASNHIKEHEAEACTTPVSPVVSEPTSHNSTKRPSAPLSPGKVFAPSVLTPGSPVTKGRATPSQLREIEAAVASPVPVTHSTIANGVKLAKTAEQNSLGNLITEPTVQTTEESDSKSHIPAQVLSTSHSPLASTEHVPTSDAGPTCAESDATETPPHHASTPLGGSQVLNMPSKTVSPSSAPKAACPEVTSFSVKTTSDVSPARPYGDILEQLGLPQRNTTPRSLRSVRPLNAHGSRVRERLQSRPMLR